MKNYLLLITLFSYQIISGQNSYNFTRISLSEGLSQSTVTSIFQDKNGFLWFGTANGLNKYDGYNFTIYKHNPFDDKTISNDYINAINEDNKGNLWIGTENGLNKFNPLNEIFIQYRIEPDDNSGMGLNSIIDIVIDEKDNLWLATYNSGLYYFDHLKNDYKKIINNSADSGFYFLTTLYKENNSFLWVGSAAGLSKYDYQNKSFENYRISEKSRNPVTSIIQADQNNLFIGTENSGLYNFNISQKKFSKISEINTAAIRSLFKDSKGNIWIGTARRGVFRFCPAENSYTNISADPSVAFSLSDNEVLSIFEDHSNVLWFGTFAGGLNKYVSMKKKFEHYKMEPGNANSLANNIVYSILKDSEGYLWVGTTNGLNKIDRKNNKYSWFNSDNSGLRYNFVSGIFEDSGKQIWASTFGGLHKYDKKNNRFNFIPSEYTNGEKPDNLIVTEIYEDKSGTLLIGSRNNGLSIFDRKTNLFMKDTLIKEQSVISILVDREGIYWLGTLQGLLRYDRRKKNIKKFQVEKNNLNSISSNTVFTIYEDSEGYLWLGTYGGGLNKFDKKKNTFYHYLEEDGLPNNVIYSVLPGRNNNIWLSTNKGLCRFNTKTNSFRIYDVSDGLQGYEFNEGAAFKSKDGEMFFGGLNGFNSFYPDSMKNNPVEPYIIISSVKILDKEFTEYKEKGYIDLSYSENFISFEFAALDYSDPVKNKYAYKLGGFDKDWIYSGSRRYASYTNLAPGKYTFNVIGSNNDNVWNREGAQILIIINPPFWKTWWFYSLSGVLLVVLVFSVHRYRLRTKIKQMLEVEKMRKNIADDFHDELGHKLTKISLYSELMKRGLKGVLNGNEVYLDKINNAANTLYDDTKDFIWSIDPVKDTLYDLAVYLKDFGDELFDKTGIAFKVKEISHDLSAIKLPMNWKRQLILLFKEAMNNILKHSACKNVELTVEMKEDFFEMNLFDDGKGFSKSDNKGRGLNNMQSRASRIEGELIIKSEEGAGTVISFKALKSKLILN